MTHPSPFRRPIRAEALPPLDGSSRLVAVIGPDGPDATLTVTIWENRISGLPIGDGEPLLSHSTSPRVEAAALLEAAGHRLISAWHEYSLGYHAAAVE